MGMLDRAIQGNQNNFVISLKAEDFLCWLNRIEAKKTNSLVVCVVFQIGKLELIRDYFEFFKNRGLFEIATACWSSFVTSHSSYKIQRCRNERWLLATFSRIIVKIQKVRTEKGLCSIKM